jgi:hypothetical protein
MTKHNVLIELQGGSLSIEILMNILKKNGQPKGCPFLYDL